MRLEHLRLTAFGKFKGQELELGPGLNVIYGPNEAGKSTVQRFIQGMLYGFYKGGTRRRLKLEEMDRYQPWSGAGYRGTLIYRLDRTGRRIRVEREFGDRSTVRVFDAHTGEPLAFPQDEGSRELAFCREQTGLSGEEFLRTACVGQNQIRIGDPGDLAVRLANLRQTGREELSVQRVDRRLDDLRRPAMEQIRRLREQWTPAEAELRRLLRVRDEYLEQAARAAELARQREALRAEVAELARQRDQARLIEIEGTLQSIRDREGELAALERRLAELAPYAAFPVHLQSELDRLEGRMRELLDHAAFQADAVEKARSAEWAAAGTLARLSDLDKLPPDAYEQAINLRICWERDQDELAQLRSNLGALRADAAQYQAQVAAVQAVGDLAQVEQDLNHIQVRCAAAGEPEPHSRVRTLQRQQGMSRRQAALAAPLLGLAVGAAAAAIGVGPGRPWVLAGFSALALVLAGSGLICARARHQVRHLGLQLEQAEADADRWSHLLAALQATDGEQARAQLRTYTELMHQARKATDMLAEREQGLSRVQERAARAAQDLERLLLPVAGLLGGAAGGPAGRVRAFEALWRQREKARADWESARKAVATAVERAQSVQQNLSDVRTRIEAILHEAGVPDSAAFAAGAAARQEWVSLSQRHADLTASLMELTGPGGVARWEAERSELVARLEVAAAGAALLEAPPGERRRLEDSLEMQTARLQGVERELARIQGQLDQAYGDTADLDRRAAEVARLQAALDEWEDRKAALDLARRELAAAAAELHRTFAPQLNERIAAVLPRLTGGRYSQVAVNEELQLQVEVADLGRWVSGAHLSAGTGDQLYLALRVALVELLVPPEKEHPPLILDDPFTQCDAERLAGAMALLSELVGEYQVLLFTCHEREVEAARQAAAGARVIVLP